LEISGIFRIFDIHQKDKTMLTKQLRQFERWADEQDKQKALKPKVKKISRREFLKTIAENPSLLFTKIKK